MAADDSNQAARSPVLCLPDVYPTDPGDCSALGPSAYLTQMAQDGMVLPLQPLPAGRLDPALGILPYQYAMLNSEPNPVYASLEDAIAGASPVRYIEAGKLKFITYVETETGDGTKPRYFKLASGEWITNVASRVSLPARYRGGLVFSRTPFNNFGWILPFDAFIRTKQTPGYETDDYNVEKVAQYSVVQIYAVKNVADLDWYQIGPDQWVPSNQVGEVIVNTTPPEGVTNGRWIEVNLAGQTVSVYDHNQLVYATLSATGQEGAWTRPGLFQIYKKYDATDMSAAFAADRSDFYYLQNVPFTMYYDKARALHGAYWRYNLGYQQSHGCVNLSVADAHWLFNWANEQDWVYVWDPTGKTPTDASFYPGEGAP